MFKKIMAKIGVGSAKIDLILPQSAYMMGDTVAGELVIQGGAVDQSINKIDIDFIIQIHTSKQIHQQVIQKIPFPEAFTIHASERKALPFSFTIPQDVLVSGSKVSYLFKTNLDIAGGIDSGDHDPIQILPPKRLDHLISAFEELGFRESHDSRSFDGYTQEFEFFPTSFLRGQVNEVEFAAALEEDQIRVLLELDLPAFGREVEIRKELSLPNDLLDDIPRLVHYLRDQMEEMVNHPESYRHVRSSLRHGYGQHPRSGFAGAMGGMVAGFLGGIIMAELLEETIEGFEEAAFGGEEEESFFDDMFGGGDE